MTQPEHRARIISSMNFPLFPVQKLVWLNQKEPSEKASLERAICENI